MFAGPLNDRSQWNGPVQQTSARFRSRSLARGRSRIFLIEPKRTD